MEPSEAREEIKVFAFRVLILEASMFRVLVECGFDFIEAQLRMKESFLLR